MNTTTHPFFVPYGDDRKQTAILLVGTADEYKISQRDIRTVTGGFRISQALADALGLDTEDDDAEDDGTEATSPAPEPDADEEPVDYSTWEYNDLKAEVSRREIQTEDNKTQTLVAALVADDETNASGNRAGENEE